MCIKRWMQKKKECPQCRAAITSVVRSIVLDNCIERLGDYLGEDSKKERMNAVAERTGQIFLSHVNKDYHTLSFCQQ